MNKSIKQETLRIIEQTKKIKQITNEINDLPFCVNLYPYKKIVTENICPPIPLREFDWRATREDYDLGDPIGEGETENEAIDDLLRKEFEKMQKLTNLERRHLAETIIADLGESNFYDIDHNCNAYDDERL